MSYYTVKYINDFFTRHKELESHFITKALEGIKRLSGYTELYNSSVVLEWILQI